MEFQKGYNDQIRVNETEQQNGFFWLENSFHIAWKEESLSITHSSININEIWDGLWLLTAKTLIYFDFGICELRIHPSIETALLAKVDETFLQIAFKIISVPSSNNCPIKLISLLVDWVEYATQKNQTILPYYCTYNTRDTMGRTYISLHQQTYVCI